MAATSQHEALHRIFRHDEGLFMRTMWRNLGVKVPIPERVSVLDVDLTEIRPIERRADSVLEVEFLVENSASKYILIVEAQTEPDKERRRRWPYYIAYLHDKYQCPVVLLVVSSKRGTAKWARDPIEIGMPGLISMVVHPVALGPDNVPPILDAEEASRDVTYAVFSAITHSRSRRRRGILEALAAALNTVDTETGALLAEFTEAGLGRTVGREIWRALMATRTFPYVSELRSQGREEGRAQGQAAAILQVLDRRGIDVDDASRAQIEACTDINTLGTWLDRSLTAAKVTDLFKD